MNRRSAVVAALAAAGIAAAAPLPVAAQEAPGKTRVYVVVVDGLRPDEVALMPFLRELAAGSTYYPESRAVMVAETIPNHVAMVTGVYPDRSGVVGNDFPDTERDERRGNEDTSLLTADSMFTLVEEQCPQLVTAAVTSKDYLFTVMDHDRTGDGAADADSNFANVEDPTFIPIAGLTPDERTVAEALDVVREQDPDFLFLNLGSVDRVGHLDVVGGASVPLPTGSRPAARDLQRTLTDGYLRAFVEQLQAAGTWDSTALLVTADHSMDWSFPTSTVSLSPQLEADPLLAGQFVIAQNGGAALYSLADREAPEAAARLARLRDIAVATDGVDEALYRQPNPLDGGEEHWVGRVHPDWHQTGPNSGDLLVTVEDGLRVTEPSPTSNPIPGNHGMPSTLRIPVVVAGGLPVVPQTVPADPDPAVRSAASAENVDMAPTAAWLLGVRPPPGGFDGRALTEAFVERPSSSCLSAAGGPGAPVAGPAPTAGRPAPAAPGPAGPRLPATGPAVLVPMAGLLLLAGAVVLRRRLLA